MKKIDILMALTIAGTISAGCVKEPWEYCPPDMYVTFVAENPRHDYAELVQNLSLYLYDPATDALIGSWDYTREELRPEDRAALLPYTTPGTYRLLAVVNDGLYTNTSGEQNFSTIQSTVNEATLAYDAEPFMSAETMITIGATAATRAANVDVVEHRMTLAKHNNNIFLHLVYNDYVPLAGTNLGAVIEAPNRGFRYGSYSSTGQALSSGHWFRADNYERDAEHLYPNHPAQFSFSTMRMWAETGTVKLKIFEQANPGATVEGDLREISIDVIDLLSKVRDEQTEELIYDTDEELEYWDEYHIVIQLGLFENPVIVIPPPEEEEGPGPIVIDEEVLTRFTFPLQVRKWEYVKGTIII